MSGSPVGPPVGAEEVVEIWERGRSQHPVDRALTLLSVLSGRPRGELAELSLETRDALLLAGRARLFGDRLAGYAACPRCGCELDVALSPGVGGDRGGSPANDSPANDSPAHESLEIEVGGVRWTVRLPTSRDLAAVAGCAGVEAARQLLVRRCLSPTPDSAAEPAELAELDAAVVAAVEEALDSRADLSAGAVSLDCPACGYDWALELDIAAFAWREVEVLAGRLLSDVDVLARRYGWTEREILGLSPARRGYYLELAS